MNIRYFKFEEDTFSKNDQGISKIYHEVFLLMRFLQAKPSVKDINIIYHDLYYTVIKNRDDIEIVINKYADTANDYFNYEDLITPSHNIGRKNNKEILK